MKERYFHHLYGAGIVGWYDCYNSEDALVIRNSYNTGNISGVTRAAGIISYIGGDKVTIENCYNTGEVNGDYSSNICTGGIIATLEIKTENGKTIINKCENSGKIISGGDNIGGIIGTIGNSYGETSIVACTNTGEITSKRYTSYGNYIGGIIAFTSNKLNIINSKNSGNIIMSQNVVGCVGGICGSDNSSKEIYIRNVYNTGNITVPAVNTCYIGGIYGNNYSQYLILENTYNSGNIAQTQATPIYAGGIVGCYYGTSIKNCYNSGNIDTVTYGNNYIGGIVGLDGTSNTIENCYNSGDVTGNYTVAGIVGYASSKITINNSHNTGNVSAASGTSGEIFGSYGDTVTLGTDCTYLIKDTNAATNGATGVTDMTETMSIANFVTLMNTSVTTNNSDSANIKLHFWKVVDGLPVFDI